MSGPPNKKMGGDTGSQASHAPPALNKFMHPRNPYRTPPSFKLLASLYPNFRQHCTYDVGGKVRLDFTQTRALAELAIALMHKDFGLTVSLPSTHLVPTIPLRLNYLLWLQDMVGLWATRVRAEEPFSLESALQLQQQQKLQNKQLLQEGATDTPLTEEQQHKQGKKKGMEPSRYTSPVIGLDIGCGASCVYGLLGARHCGFHMLASDTDPHSIATARHNVQTNAMAHQLHITQGSADSLLGVLEAADVQQFLCEVRRRGTAGAASAVQEGEAEPMDVDEWPGSSACDGSGYLLDFTMCNPPFFSSEQEADSSTKTKKQRAPPNNAYTGTLQETVVEGGEVAFISKMVQESIAYKDKIRVFSTLVGTAADLKRVRQLVVAAAPLHHTVTEFCQGRTMRWGVAWSWCPAAPLERVQSRKQCATAKPLILLWPRASCLPVYTVTAAWESIAVWLAELKIKPKVFKTTKYFVGATVKAYKATWQGQRQRRREDARRDKQKEGDKKGCPTSPSSSHSTDESLGCCVSPPDSATMSPPECDVSKRPLSALEELDDGIMETTPKKMRLDDGDHDVDYSAAAVSDSEDDDETAAAVSTNGVVGSDAAVECVEATANGKSTSESVTATSAPKQTGLPCLLKANLFVKLVNNQLVLEMHVQGGQLGRDGANQLLTFFRNRLQKKPNVAAVTAGK